jgi:hypothetical protein
MTKPPSTCSRRLGMVARLQSPHAHDKAMYASEVMSGSDSGNRMRASQKFEEIEGGCPE